jgi:hypothetical protein
MPRRALLLALMLIVPAACGSPPLANTQRSAQGVASAVLDSLARGDRAALEALALNEQEFEDLVWPYLPAARPERNLPLSYVWGDLHQKSQGALTRTLGTHGGRRYELVGIDFTDRTDYGAFVVHREASLHVRDASGMPMTIRVCGSMIERDGGWKVFSYVVDE